MAKHLRKSALPGFGLALGLTCAWLGLVAIVPLIALVARSATLSGSEWLAIATSPQVVAALRLSFGASLLAAFINVFAGLLIAWVLTRYRFPGRTLADAVVDLPFALPTAVAGIALTAIYGPDGWFGSFLEGRLGWKIAFAQPGIVIALAFIGLPFVVRTVQPVLQALDPEVEEAAESLGASRWQVFSRVLLPTVAPALLTGFTLAFARAVGEYGSVVFISGNIPGQTAIAPLLIVSRLEEYDYAGATAIATIMLGFSALLLLAIGGLQTWQIRRRTAAQKPT